MKNDVLNLYKMQARVYDEYMSTEIEARNFDRVFKQIKKAKNKQGITSVLDLCCGTGILPRKWLTRLENIIYTGVDINDEFLEFAQQKNPNKNYKFIQANAVTINLNQRFDIIIGTSAYHHIKDEQKIKFLNNIKHHLKPEGTGIIYEKFVSPFNNIVEAARSGTNFYAERIYYMMQKEKVSDIQLFALYNELYLTSIREDEYKVPYNHFIKDLNKAGLKVVEEIKLWPKDNRFKDPKVGDFVIVFRK